MNGSCTASRSDFQQAITLQAGKATIASCVSLEAFSHYDFCRDKRLRCADSESMVVLQVYRLISCGTVEEKIYRNQVFKGALSRRGMQEDAPYQYFSQQVSWSCPLPPSSIAVIDCVYSKILNPEWRALARGGKITPHFWM